MDERDVCANCGEFYEHHMKTTQCYPDSADKWFPKKLADAITASVQDGPADQQVRLSGRCNFPDCDCEGETPICPDHPANKPEDGPADSADQQGNQVERLTEVELLAMRVPNNLPWQAGYNTAIEDVRQKLFPPPLAPDTEARSAVPAPPSKSAPTELPALDGEALAKLATLSDYQNKLFVELKCRERQLREALGLSAPLREEDHAVKSKGASENGNT